MEIIPPPIVASVDPSVRFGQVALTEEAALFRHAMNREMMAFFR
jgi:hypothetical protein